jgi:hypothetical protein
MVAMPSDGRDQSNGRFAQGNRWGRGGPHCRRAMQLRAALFDAITVDDIKGIAQTLIAKARDKGDTYAAHEIFDRIFGKSPQAMFLEINEDPNSTDPKHDWSRLTVAELSAVLELSEKAKIDESSAAPDKPSFLTEEITQ